MLEKQITANGTLILVFGLLGFAFCPPFGMIAWIMSTNSLRLLDKAGVKGGTERTLVTVGRICGIVSTLLWLGFLLLKLLSMNAGR